MSKIKTNEQGNQCTFAKGAETAHFAAETATIRRVANFMLEDDSYQGYVNAVVQQERVTNSGFRLGPSPFMPQGVFADGNSKLRWASSTHLS